MFHSGVGSGAPRGSWPGSCVPPISPAQKCRTLPSRRDPDVERRPFVAVRAPGRGSRARSRRRPSGRTCRLRQPRSRANASCRATGERPSTAKRDALREVAHRRVERAEEGRAHRAGPLALRAEHPEVGDQRVVRAEQVGEAAARAPARRGSGSRAASPPGGSARRCSATRSMWRRSSISSASSAVRARR